MPDIKLTQVMSVSSEDPAYPAKNLLNPEDYKKWKGKSAGEKEVSVLLKFEKSTEIEAVHVGNEGSAFVEILVGKLGDDIKNFQVLLPTSSFMSPAESRTGASAGRVRLFERDRLAAAALGRPWDCARIVCTQPFSRSSQYGLAFVRLRAPEPAQAPAPAPAAALGSFSLRPEPADVIRPGSLFSRRAELSSGGGGALKREDRGDLVVPPRHPEAPSTSDRASAAETRPRTSAETGHRKPAETSQKKRAETGHRNSAETSQRNSSETSQRKPAATSQRKPAETSQRKPAETSQKKPSESTQKKPPGNSQKKPTENKPSQPNGSGDPAGGERPSASATYRPFGRLLSDVVFAMSGYQNPERARLREDGLKLGAAYRPDWTPACTHLVCAFRNTPKYSQVSGRGGRIVSGDWLRECARRRRRLPWRLFALDSRARDAPDSDADEVWADDMRPPSADDGPGPSTSKADDADDYGGSTDEMDTDDEIQMAQVQCAGKLAQLSPAAGVKRKAASPHSSDTTRPDRAASPAAAAGSDSSDSSDAAYDADTDEEEPGTTGGQVAELADFLRGRTFLLYGDAMSAETRRQAARAITAFGGRVEPYFGDSVQYVITSDSWDSNFDEAVASNPDLTFARPAWLEACARSGKLVPPHAYLVTSST